MSDNKREVELAVSVGLSGDDSLVRLAQSLRDTAKAGGDAAPELNRLADALDKAQAQAEQLRAAEEAARSEAVAQKRTVAEQVDALARLRAESDRAKRGTDEYAAAVRAQRLEIIDARAALRDKQAALTAASSAASQAASAEQRLVAEANSVAAAFRKQGDATTTAARSAAGELERIGSQLRALQTLAGAALGGSLLGGVSGDVARAADAFNNLQARVKLAAGEGANFDAVLQGVEAIAQRTGSSLELTADLYGKVATSTKALGLTTAETLGVVEGVSQAIQLSGGSAESSAAAVTQFAQALSSGVLRGDELNSILEQSPRLAKALADGLGVTQGELRKLGEAGSLSAKAVIGALQGQSAALQKEFDSLPPTIGRSVTALANSWTVYVGEVDKATGASGTAAKAIKLLADNLSTVGTLLLSAGKAAAAYTAVNLAKSLLTTAEAATVTTKAMTGLATATAAANAEAVAGTGKFGALLGSLKLFGLLSVLTNLREIGTALGEGAAKALGYGKAIEELERTQAADAEAARRWAASTAAVSQQLQIAADKALGLTDQSRALFGEFDGVIAKGGSVSDALGKIAKSLDLGDLTSIAAAGAALDALALKGKVSAGQISEAFASALKGEDLARFRIQAMAAFDDTEMGARRLKAAIDGIAIESLRRAGTSLEELKTGFSAASTAAINDLDELTRALDGLGIKSDDTGRVLAGSLDKALAAAATERAVQAVILRFEALGKQGLISGEQLAEGLEKARQKIEDLKPGIQGLDEALRNFGLHTKSELQATADKLAASYAQIAASTTVSLADQRKAFDAYSAAAITANRGVETEAVKVARTMLEIKEAAAGAGAGIEAGMQRGGRAVDDVGVKINSLGERLYQVAGTLSGVLKQVGDLSILGSNKYDAQGFALGADGQRLNLTGQVNVPDGYTFDQAQFLRDQQQNARTGGNAPDPANYHRAPAPGLSGTREPYVAPDGAQRNGNAGYVSFGGAPAPAAPAPAPAPAAAPAPTPVTIHLPGSSPSTINVSGASDAKTLANLLAVLTSDKNRSGS